MLVKFEQIRIVRTTRNFELFDKKSGFLKSFLTKRWRHFRRGFCSWINYLMLKTIYLKTTIFQCSKNYGSPTGRTGLKVALNMADPISLNENLP